MPDIGDFKDVPVIAVLVKAGDTVAKDDPLVELESDKATMEVPSPAGGTVKEISVKEGDKVSEGSLILVLAAAAGAADRGVAAAARGGAAGFRRLGRSLVRPAADGVGCRRRGGRRPAARIAFGQEVRPRGRRRPFQGQGLGPQGPDPARGRHRLLQVDPGARAGRGGGAVGRHGHPADPEGRLLEVRPGRGRRDAADQEDLRPRPASLVAERAARHPQRRGGHHRDRQVPQGARHQGQGGGLSRHDALVPDQGERVGA